MKKQKLLNAICLSLFISGITILFSYKPKYVGLIILVLSFIMGYILHSSRIIIEQKKYINLKNVALGIFLIIFIFLYNSISNGEFGPFKYGMLFSGIFIIFLNLNFLNFLKFDPEFLDFLSIFLFIVMILYGTLFTGIPFLLRTEENPFFIPITKLAVTSSGYLLNFIKPTTVIEGTNINYDGFVVRIWFPCSGVESITVFISAISAFFISIREKNVRKIITLSIIGIVALYSFNILRIMILILVGRYYGIDALMFTHYNLGWIMFVIGMGIFWYLVFDTREGTLSKLWH